MEQFIEAIKQLTREVVLLRETLQMGQVLPLADKVEMGDIDTYNGQEADDRAQLRESLLELGLQPNQIELLVDELIESSNIAAGGSNGQD